MIKAFHANSCIIQRAPQVGGGRRAGGVSLHIRRMGPVFVHDLRTFLPPYSRDSDSKSHSGMKLDETMAPEGPPGTPRGHDRP